MLKANANVYDIRNLDISRIKGETFAIDTNVLYWMHYTRCTETQSGYQLSLYPNFISELLLNNNNLVTTIYNITELLYIIERNEFEIYKINNCDIDCNISRKQFRAITTERLKVKEYLNTVLMQIEQLYDIREFNIEILGVKDFIDKLETHKCDDFDYLIIDYLKARGIYNIVTDDSDYVYMNSLNIYTANNRTIKEAENYGKLVI